MPQMREASTGTDERHSVLRVEIVVRIAFAAVFLLNVMCAIQFVVSPELYASAYQLDGAAGRAAVRGIGVAFLMWNATYPLFIWSPSRHVALGMIILIQQGIGLIGESVILISLPKTGFEALSSSIIRFIAFDAAGLMLMLLSFIWLVVLKRRSVTL